MFIKYNANPERLTTDCVIRAISKATNKSWLEVFDELVSYARANYVMPSSKECYTNYLKDYSTINIYKIIGNKKKRLQVKDIKASGIYIVRVANHLVTCIDGNYYDTFDCGNKCAYKIWRVN